jgi:hypothetical protein
MPVINAVVTNLARQLWPQIFGGIIPLQQGTSATTATPYYWCPVMRFFRIGRGGWVNPGPTPRAPDPSLTDLDIIVDTIRQSHRYSGMAGNILFFQKNFVSTDLTWESPTTLKCACKLLTTEFNDISGVPSNPPGGSSASPIGTNPVLYEIGVYADYPGITNIPSGASVPTTWSPTPPDPSPYAVTSHPPIGTTASLLVAYGTFHGQTKVSGSPLENDVRISFGRV